MSRLGENIMLRQNLAPNIHIFLPEGVHANTLRSGVLKTPCLDCTENINNWTWKRQKCYGSVNKVDLTPETLATHYFNMFIEKSVTQENWSAEKCLERLPEESRVYFQKLLDTE